MNQLVEGVLSIGARFTPDDWPCAVVYPVTMNGDAFAVALHIALLKVSREARQVLVIGQDGVRLCAEKVVIPDSEQAHDNRNVFLEGRGTEIFVYVVRPCQQFLEATNSDRQRDGEAYRGPERITTANPIPELKHILGIDAELLHLCSIG